MPTATVEAKKFLNVPELAAYTGLSPGTIRVWCSNRKHGLPVTRMGRAVRFDKARIDAWIAARTTGTNTK